MAARAKHPDLLVQLPQYPGLVANGLRSDLRLGEEMARRWRTPEPLDVRRLIGQSEHAGGLVAAERRGKPRLDRGRLHVRLRQRAGLASKAQRRLVVGLVDSLSDRSQVSQEGVRHTSERRPQRVADLDAVGLASLPAVGQTAEVPRGGDAADQLTVRLDLEAT